MMRLVNVIYTGTRVRWLSIAVRQCKLSLAMRWLRVLRRYEMRIAESDASHAQNPHTSRERRFSYLWIFVIHSSLKWCYRQLYPIATLVHFCIPSTATHTRTHMNHVSVFDDVELTTKTCFFSFFAVVLILNGCDDRLAANLTIWTTTNDYKILFPFFVSRSDAVRSPKIVELRAEKCHMWKWNEICSLCYHICMY